MSKYKQKQKDLFLRFSRKSKNYLLNFEDKAYLNKNYSNININFELSRANKNNLVCFVSKNNEQNEFSKFLFFKKFKRKIIYLYDSNSLINDYNLKNNLFRTFNNNDPNIFLHLAISYYEKDDGFENCTLLVKEFILKSPNKMKGKKLIKFIDDYIYLFKPIFIGHELFNTAYRSLSFFLEIAITNQIYAEYLEYSYLKLLERNENDDFAIVLYLDRIFLLGESFFLLEQFDKAIQYFKLYYVIYIDGENTLYHESRDDVALRIDYAIIIGSWSKGMKFWGEKDFNNAKKAFQDFLTLYEHGNYFHKLLSYIIDTINSKGDVIPLHQQLNMCQQWMNESKIKELSIFNLDRSPLDMIKMLKMIYKKMESIEEGFFHGLEKTSELEDSGVFNGEKKITRIYANNTQSEQPEESEAKQEFARMWTNDTDPKGIPISVEQKKNVIEKKEKYQLLVIIEKTRTQIYLEGEPKKIPGNKAFQILCYLLTHNGYGGTLWNIAQNIYGETESIVINDIKQGITKLKNSDDFNIAIKQAEEGYFNGKVLEFSKRVKSRITNLNNTLFSNYFSKLTSNELSDDYSFSTMIKFCIIKT